MDTHNSSSDASAPTNKQGVQKCCDHTSPASSKECKENRETLLLVGNSPNLVDEHHAKSEWNRLLTDLETDLADYVLGIGDLPSFTHKIQAIHNLYCLSSAVDDRSGSRQKIAKAIHKWLQGVGRLQPTAIHRMLVELDFDHYLTTNYDFALDKALNSRDGKNTKFGTDKNILDKIDDFFGGGKGVLFKKSQVFHIHGNISNLASMLMTPMSYHEAIYHLKECRDKGKKAPEYEWLEHFCSAEVHICGFNPRPDEAVFWYALEQRFRAIRKRDPQGSYPRTFVYLFYDDASAGDMREKLALSVYLKTFAVKTILIPVRQGDYASAWKQLIGEIMLRKMNLKIHQSASSETETPVELGDELVEALERIERGGGRSASRGTNLSTAFTENFRLPYHCMFEISKSKKAHIRSSNRWMCYCKIDGVAYMYQFPYIEPIPLLTEDDNEVQVFVNYRTGELFHAVDGRLLSLGFGHHIRNVIEFAGLIYPQK